MGGLLLRLAHHCANGQGHNYKTCNGSTQGDIHSNSSPTHLVDRQRLAVIRLTNFSHLQSNGDLCTAHPPHTTLRAIKAEAAVKSMKKLIYTAWNGRYLEEDTLCQALMQYRNTTYRKDGVSPAQKIYGHPVQDTLPAHRRSFAPEWQCEAEHVEQSAQASQKIAVKYYNSSAHSLPDIKVGSHVAVQHPKTKLWDTYGVVTSIGPHGQYHVKIGTAKIAVHNCRFLQRRVPGPIPPGRTTQPQTPVPPFRRSGRDRKPANRLIEDPLWA